MNSRRMPVYLVWSSLAVFLFNKNVFNGGPPKVNARLAFERGSVIADMVVTGHRQSASRVGRIPKSSLDVFQVRSVNVFQERAPGDVSRSLYHWSDISASRINAVCNESHHGLFF